MVSILGLGTVKLGRNKSVSYKNVFQLPTIKEAELLLETAISQGINLIDTAPAYGASESILGTLIQGNRDRWILCSKVGEEFDGEQSVFNFSRDHIISSIMRSIQRLNSEYLDIAVIHSNGDDLKILDDWQALDTLQKLKSLGLIRAVGISHKTTSGAERAISLGADVIMATLNRHSTNNQQIADIAQRYGCGVLIKKPLAKGYAMPSDLSWIASTPGVSSIVVGTTNPDHLIENANVLST